MKVGHNLPKSAKLCERRGGLMKRSMWSAEQWRANGSLLCAKSKRLPALLFHSAGAGLPGTANPMRGRLTVVGLGPGSSSWITLPRKKPSKRRRTSTATNPILNVSRPCRQRLHMSDNRVELARAEAAITAAQSGREVVIASGGDPGVFAMAAGSSRQSRAARRSGGLWMSS